MKWSHIFKFYIRLDRGEHRDYGPPRSTPYKVAPGRHLYRVTARVNERRCIYLDNRYGQHFCQQVSASQE